ncbi:MAG TPA: phenylalanine--tRNA ligase subunit beta [Candidatus Binataceae bacterium]|nr:phenylalanine--tRNA ligase subunit beta [Candidatus Binataceae bacterium]
MKLPLSWLREFVTVEADLEEICRRLTMAGVEVENVEQIAATFTDVYVAKVLAVERHPNADRLNLCDVDAGAAGRFRVVCGAPNVYAGMTAALAKIGARLAGGVHGEGSGRIEEAVPLQAATIRGVQSEGMLCSELELGLSKDHQGILELAADAKPGDSLATYLQMPDAVLDIAVTPNRGDCLSILGLAREIAALFGAKLKLPRLRQGKAPAGPEVEGYAGVSVDIVSPELCPRYAALPMTGIKIGPSPVWLRRRLELAGMRALNSVVDATNYVMIELGQPLHAFDMERIADRTIVVRRAGEDREFATLDGANRTLEAGDLMIADREKPLAIAGIMGGQNSEVSSSTTSIVIESAYFEPMTIARTARRLGLRSEASYRFERGIDRGGQVNGLLRASELIRKLAGGCDAAPVIDVEPIPARRREIDFDLDAIGSLLGLELPAAEVKRRLKAVGLEVSAAGRDRLKVVAPSFRPDINETADLAEEVARLAGLAEIPATVPVRGASTAPPDPVRGFMRKTREIMVGCGLVEAKTIAFIAPAENERFAGLAAAEAVRVSNPLSAELSEMRRSLIPGLLAALRFNLNREATAFHAFEIGKVFGTRDGVPREYERIAGVSYADYALAEIGQPALKAGFFSVKGIIETYLRTIGVPERIEYEPVPDGLAPYLHPGRAARIALDGVTLGVIGELHPGERLRMELSEPCVLFELDLSQLIAYGSLPRQTIETPPKFPAVRRDLALVIAEDVPADRVQKTILEISSPLLESAELFDVYRGSSIPQGKKSVALACRYRGKDRTLTDDEVNRLHAALVEAAKGRLGAELRQ